MAALRELRRKVRKANSLRRNPLWLRAMRQGCAAAIEHEDALKDLPIDTIIDVGANRGQFTVLMRGLRPDARIFAFEPLEEATATFERVNAGCENVSLHRCALGAEASSAAIKIGAKSDVSSFFGPGQLVEFGDDAKLVGERIVPIERLDAVLDGELRPGNVLLKLDVQGYEMEVLSGSTGIIDQIDWIYTEVAFTPIYENQPLFNELHQQITEFGFVPLRVGHVSGTPSNPKSTGDFLYGRPG